MYLGVSTTDVPTDLNEFFTELKSSFGVGGSVLGQRIIRRLHAEFGLTLPTPNAGVSESSQLLVNFVKEISTLGRMV